MKKGCVLLFVIFIFQSCGIDTDVLEYSESEVDEEFDIILLYPENNSSDPEGTIVSNTENELEFEWKDKDGETYSPYNLQLVNLLNNDTIVYESLETQTTISLQLGVSYSWYVTGVSNSISDIWVFDNLGIQNESVFPEPATAVSPVSGASISQTSTTVNLIWQSEDVNIIGFDLYFGESENPDFFAEDITETRFNDISVEANKVYYWKIVTKNSIGNESTSEVFTFSVG
ncbi:hypothetical protein [Maribacter sp. Asnod1-A12]|uniref:hypothetical protein n=1 Tax=Maribacter sp. Asnod1-A12 TaxID=3160576 RepID=UPI00386409AC